MNSERDKSASRREFLAAVGAAAALGERAAETAAPVGMPPDTPRELPGGRADLGSLLPEVLKLTEDRPYALSFLADRFADLAAWKTA
ncbi:MAG: hypothetical protein FJX77_16175, partial [Armatimonadetes bacterium]|nr:hypothetical protein [Armatimonadota bacterium]